MAFSSVTVAVLSCLLIGCFIVVTAHFALGSLVMAPDMCAVAREVAPFWPLIPGPVFGWLVRPALVNPGGSV